MRKDKRVRANVAVAVVISIIACVISALSLGYTAYRAHYQDYNIDAGSTIKMNFNPKSSKTSSFSIAPSKGNMMYGLMQSKGNKTCKYTFSYKQNTHGSYTGLKNNYSFPKNNKYYGPWKICYSNGKAKYNAKVTKTAGTDKESSISLEWMID